MTAHFLGLVQSLKKKIMLLSPDEMLQRNLGRATAALLGKLSSTKMFPATINCGFLYQSEIKHFIVYLFTLSTQLQNLIEKEVQWIPLTHKCMTAHFLGLV
jgi:hypothetical protein